jgi:hypothetical protein
MTGRGIIELLNWRIVELENWRIVEMENYCCPDKKYIVLNRTFLVLYQILYQYIVPNGTVPEGLDVGRIKNEPLKL